MKRYFVLASGLDSQTAWMAVLTVMLITASSTAQKLQMPSSIDEGSVTSTSKVTTSTDDTPYSDESQSDVAVPASYSTAGMYYNPTLGSHIRARYNTQSYGQDRGNLDLGTMRVWDLGDSVSFFDGQVTLNEESHVGYNLGLGYRWMDVPVFPFSADNQKIYGVSLWADGQGAGGDNFFPQIGLGFEILGDRTDFRTNVYIPLGPESQDRDFVSGGENSYSGNFLAEGLVGVRDTSLSVVDSELAGRISNLEAWVFGGVYGYSGGEYDEVGGKVGLRGYATPDLALQIALTNDAVFDTNAVFSATWFIGRTRRENRPTGALRDRFREPVIRNDYIALKSESVSGVGDILLDVNGDPIRIVHIDSTAAAGGDGTFENPFNTLAAAGGGGSVEGDILLAHAGSAFTAEELTLKDNQRLLGEGVVFDDGNLLTTETNIDHTVTVFGGGTESLPETATDAFTMAAPTITNTTETAVLLADNNEVNNLVISGGVVGLMGDTFDPLGGTNGSGDQNLQNLQISGTTGNAIELTMARRIDDTNPSNGSLEMDVNINNIELNSIGGAYGILLNANAVVGPDDFRNNANTSPINESTTINGLTINGGTGVGIGIQNLDNSTANVTASNFAYDGSGTGQGAIEVMDSSANITFDNTSSITNTGGVAIMVDGNSPNFIYNGSLTNSGGNSVTVQNLTGGQASFTFEGGLDDDGTGITVDNLSDGDVTFATSDSSARNSITTTGTEDAIEITNINDSSGDVPTIEFNDIDIITVDGTGIEAERNAVASNENDEGRATFNDTTIDVTGNGIGVDLTQDDPSNFQTVFNGLQVTTTTGDAIVGADNRLTVAAGTDITTNTLTTTTGTALNLTNTTTQGIAFDDVNVTAGGANALLLDNVGDGPVTIGSNTGDGDAGTINATGVAVDITDVDDFTLGDIIIASSGATAISVENTDDTDRSSTFNNIQTPNGIETALDVDQTGSGAQSITVTDSEFNGTTNAAESAVEINDTTGTVLISNTTIGTLANGGAGGGIALANTGGTVTVDNGTTITNQAGTALSIDNGDGQIIFDGTIENTAGQSVAIQNKTGGGVSFSPTASITDNGGTGIVVNNNSGGDYTLLANYDLDTGANAAVTVTNNTGSNVSFSSLDINTTSGNGFVASGGGTIGVNSGSTIISTAGGRGIDMSGVTIANAGVNFDSVSTDGADNGVLLNNLDGNGSVRIQGGTIANSTGNAIQATNVTNLDINDVTVNGATGGDAITLVNNDAAAMDVRIDNLTAGGTITGAAVNASHTGSGAFDLGITNSANIGGEAIVTASGGGAFDLFVSNTNFTTGEDVTGFDLNLSGSLSNADIEFDNVDITTNDGIGFAFNTSGTSTDVRFAMLNGSILNDSDTATTRAFDGDIGGTTRLEATIGSNVFDNGGTGETFLLSSTSSNVEIDLNLNSNSATTGSITLDETLGTFRVVDVTNANANNNSNVIFTPAIGDFDDITIGDVTLPND